MKTKTMSISKKMTLRQFANLCGCKIVSCEKEWGGRYAYTTKDSPNITFCGFKTAAEARSAWLDDTLGGSIAGDLVKKLLFDEERNHE